MLGDDRPANYPTPYRHMLQCPMFELKFPRNQSFPGIADLWAVKALVWTTNPTRSPTPESRKSTQPKRVPAACLFYTEVRIFGHMCTPISWKPEFSCYCVVCAMRVPPFDCKTHKVASSRKSALGDDRFTAEEGTRTLLFYMEVCIFGHFRNIFLGLSR